MAVSKLKSLYGNPLALFASVVLFTTGFVLTYRYGIAPVLAKRRREQAEDWANYLFEEQQRKKSE